MMRKGQAAMEFLMTYGWAILVVLVAIGALAYFGVLSPAQFLPEKCTLSSGSGLFCDDFAITTTEIKIAIHNILPDQVTGVTVEIFKPGATTATCSTSSIGILAADSTETATLTGCISTSGDDFQDKVKADVKVSFTKNNLPKVATGSLIGNVPP